MTDDLREALAAAANHNFKWMTDAAKQLALEQVDRQFALLQERECKIIQIPPKPEVGTDLVTTNIRAWLKKQPPWPGAPEADDG